jgi:hypothetical protein
LGVEDPITELEQADLSVPEEAAEGVLEDLVKNHGFNPRDAEVITLAAQNEIHEAIGRSVGVSRRRVGQILEQRPGLHEEKRAELRYVASRPSSFTSRRSWTPWQ